MAAPDFRLAPPSGAAQDRPPLRVLILSADVGDGHLSAARALAAALEAGPERVETAVVNDFAVLGPAAATLLRRGFRTHLGRVGWTYELTYRLFMGSPAARRAGRAALHRLAGGALARFVAGRDPDVVVSTYPVITTALGELRRRGRLRTPACAVICDLTGLHFWAHPGIDLHLVMYERSVAEAQRIAGAGRVRAVRPLVAESLYVARDRTQARAALGLPVRGPLFVVSGGGWAVGDLAGAARAALAVPGATVVVLAGRNAAARAALRAELAGEPRARVWGFTDRMDELLAAADALVDATAGMTCLEAHVRGCPVVCHGFDIGHVRANARAQVAAGWARAAASPRELTAALERLARPGARGAPAHALRALPDAAQLVVGLAGGAPRAPAPARPPAPVAPAPA